MSIFFFYYNYIRFSIKDKKKNLSILFRYHKKVAMSKHISKKVKMNHFKSILFRKMPRPYAWM